MRTRGLLTELLGRPGHDALWRRLLGWFIRARAELTVITAVVIVHAVLVAQTGWTHAVVWAVESSTVVVVMVVPVSRRYVTRRMWAVCSRHRIGTCMVQTRTMTPDGKIPLQAWARPSPIGERVQVWLRAGLSVNDLSQITEALAAACYAAEARVEVNRRFTHLAVITIVRRDPFTGKTLVRPKHTTGVPATGRDDVFVPLPDRDTVHVPAQGQPTGQPGRTRRGTGKSRPAAATTATATATTPGTSSPTVVGVGGMDVSDYV
jgi:hypothetical protein